MRTVLPVADRLTRTHWRGLLLKLLGEEALVRRLVVGAEGGMVIQTQDWDTYWEPLLELGLPAVTDKLQALFEVWRSYLASRLARELRREYCFRYFTLLDSVLHECRARTCAGALRRALQRVVGFECLGIAAAGAEAQEMAAATTTLRNPCYLLAKLKAPDAPDDCKFLPLVAIGGDGSAKLFYHYRQHKLAMDSGSSLLLYLAASQADRQRSFQVINALERQIDEGKDPRANERAKRLARGILIPYIRGVLSDEAMPGDGPVRLGLIDLGSGSGGSCRPALRPVAARSRSPGS